MNLDPFWAAVDQVLNRIASEKPNTFDSVKAIRNAQSQGSESIRSGAVELPAGGLGRLIQRRGQFRREQTDPSKEGAC